MIINLKKPKGLTSHDVVNQVRRITGEKRVGHGGTLDPTAEGVLVIGIGRESTRKLHGLLKDADKEYVATIELGKTSDTDDSEGMLRTTGNAQNITVSDINKITNAFLGEIKQTPPAYSALKISGSPAYKLARSKQDFVLLPRTIRIKAIELIDFRPPLLTIRVIAGAGTYIRALARDIGTALGTGGYLKTLMRTRVGQYSIEDALSLEQLTSLYNKEKRKHEKSTN